MKKAIFNYTLNRKEAHEDKFPMTLGIIHNCSIREPRSTLTFSPPNSPDRKRRSTLDDSCAKRPSIKSGELTPEPKIKKWESSADI